MDLGIPKFRSLAPRLVASAKTDATWLGRSVGNDYVPMVKKKRTDNFFQLYENEVFIAPLKKLGLCVGSGSSVPGSRTERGCRLMYSLYTRQLSKEDERTHGTVDPDDSVRRWVYDDFCSDLTTN